MCVNCKLLPTLNIVLKFRIFFSPNTATKYNVYFGEINCNTYLQNDGLFSKLLVIYTLST